MQIGTVVVPAVGGLYGTDNSNRVEKESGSADARERKRERQDGQSDEKHDEVPQDILELSEVAQSEEIVLPTHALVYTSEPKPGTKGEVLPLPRLDIQA